jgi:hypothetical protein
VLIAILQQTATKCCKNAPLCHEIATGITGGVETRPGTNCYLPWALPKVRLTTRSSLSDHFTLYANESPLDGGPLLEFTVPPRTGNGQHVAILAKYYDFEVARVEFTVATLPEVAIRLEGLMQTSVRENQFILQRDTQSEKSLTVTPYVDAIALRLDGQELPDALSSDTQTRFFVRELETGDHVAVCFWHGRSIKEYKFAVIEAPAVLLTLAGGRQLGSSHFYLQSEPPTHWKLECPSDTGEFEVTLDRNPVGRGTSSFSGAIGELRPDVWHAIAVFWQGGMIQRRRFWLAERGVTFIGRRPGEICAADEAHEWDEVWLHKTRGGRSFQVFLCAEGTDSADPIPEPVKDKRKVRDWVEAVYRERRNTSVPEGGEPARLWQQYVNLGKAHQ